MEQALYLTLVKLLRYSIVEIVVTAMIIHQNFKLKDMDLKHFKALLNLHLLDNHNKENRSLNKIATLRVKLICFQFKVRRKFKNIEAWVSLQ